MISNPHLWEEAGSACVGIGDCQELEAVGDDLSHSPVRRCREHLEEVEGVCVGLWEPQTLDSVEDDLSSSPVRRRREPVLASKSPRE
jgi:hypothetical protein